jgi:hypothetical protein
MELEVAIKHWKNNLDRWKKDRPDLSNTEIVEEIDQDYKAIETVLNHITKQDKMVDRMAKALHLFIWKNDEKIMITSKPIVSCHTLSIEEIKQYFENKAEEDSKCTK